jgi:tetratricopeptide (TPR) repeat protein
MLNTEWGDGGHFNLLATALPGLASGAEHAWSHARADDETVGRRWPLHVLGDATGEAERVVALADGGDWQGGIFSGFGDERKIDFEALKTTPRRLLKREEAFADRLSEAADRSLALAARLSAARPEGGPATLAALEWAVLSGFTLGKNLAVRGQLHKLLGRAREARKLFARAAAVTADLLPDYRSLWLLRNHESELDWSMKRFRRAIARWRRAAKA